MLSDNWVVLLQFNSLATICFVLDGAMGLKVVGGAPVCKLNASIGAAAVSEGVLNQWIDNAAAIEDLVNVVRANYPFFSGRRGQ